MNQLRAEQEAAAAKELAEQEAQAKAQAEQTRIQAEQARQQEIAQTRRDAQISGDRYMQFQAQAKRDKEMEERMAVRKNQEQMEAWKRALAIPIRRP